MEDFGGALMPCTIRYHFPNSVSRYWTNQATECYKNGLQCSKCELPEDIKAKCRMKGVVLDLVMKYGRPHKEEEWEGK